MEKMNFRGISSHKGEWVYGYYWYDNFMKVHNIQVEEWCDLGWNVKIERKTLGVYTGISDKNGYDVYESDIVKTNAGLMVVKFGEHSYDSAKEMIDGIYLPCWGFYLESPCGSYCVNISKLSEEIEVVGNVFENYELLEGSK